MTAFDNAYKNVPAYKKFIHDNLSIIDGKRKMPKSFEDIPETGKKEYIQAAKTRNDLFLHGELPKKGQSDTTTGTTGKPVVWTRSAEEVEVTRKLMTFARNAKFGKDEVCLINTFALGPWATGVTLAGAGIEQGLTFNPGTTPDYIALTLENLKLIPEDRAIVICGYPPNVRKIAAAISDDPELSKKKMKLHAIVGGEGMTEDLRQDIIDKGFTNVYSSYGASDLDINIGNETDTEIAIRKACIENPALAKELYGGGPPPMIFNYDPLHYYIETNKNNELVFTCCRKEKASPRIRYNLHDTGKVMMAKDVVAILKKYGVEINPKVNLPFVFVHGREGAVSIGGAKVPFDHLEQAIRALDRENELIKNDRFALHKPDDNHLEFWLEATSEEAYEELRENIDQWQKDIIDKIEGFNADFQDSLKVPDRARPKVRVFKPGQSPMSIHAKEKPQSKLQRVVPNNETVQNHLRDNPDCYAISSEL